MLLKGESWICPSCRSLHSRGMKTKPSCDKCGVANPNLTEAAKRIYAALSHGGRLAGRSFGKSPSQHLRHSVPRKPSAPRNLTPPRRSQGQHQAVGARLVRGLPGGLVGDLLHSGHKSITGLSVDTTALRSGSSMQAVRGNRPPPPPPLPPPRPPPPPPPPAPLSEQSSSSATPPQHLSRPPMPQPGTTLPTTPRDPAARAPDPKSSNWTPFIWNSAHEYWQIKEQSGRLKAACIECKQDGRVSVAVCINKRCARCGCSCGKHRRLLRKAAAAQRKRLRDRGVDDAG